MLFVEGLVNFRFLTQVLLCLLSMQELSHIIRILTFL